MLEKNIVLRSSLLNRYAICGAFEKARQVFQILPLRDVVTWSVLLVGYAQQGQVEEALKCFDSMQQEGHSPDAVAFASALRASGSIGAISKGEEIHEKIVRLGMLEKNIQLGSCLVDMYVKCSAHAKAQQVLEGLPARDVVTWSILIAGNAQQGQGLEALKCFDSMQQEGHIPNVVTFTCALKACGNIGAAMKGEQIHHKILSLSMLEKDIILGNALVDMYARCGALVKAQEVIKALPVPDVATWNAIIAGYIQQGQGEEALRIFDSMQHEGHCPDAITFTYALKACGILGAIIKGQKICDKIVSLGMLKRDTMLGNALVDMYAKCGALAKAQAVVKELPFRDVVTWSVLIACYTQQGQGEEALKCYHSMEYEGHSPDAIVFMCALKACGMIGAAAKGEQIHSNIVSLDILKNNIELGNTLVDMYAKCAALEKGLQVFNELPVQNVVTWNALVGGYSQQGQSLEVLNCLEAMQAKGVKPDSVTLVHVLTVCSHSGLLDLAEMFFSKMSTKFGIMPLEQHYCCMVDLFGRAGKLRKALFVIEKMASAEHFPVWVALLGACRNWGEVSIGRLAVERALHLDKNDTDIYVCMANICTAVGIQDDEVKIWMMPGCWWLTVET